MRARVLVLVVCISFAAISVVAHGGEEHVMGTVIKVTANSITVKTAAKESVTVGVAALTKFTKGKAAAKIADVSVGDRVVIHAKEADDEKLVADTVEFSAAVKPAQTGGKVDVNQQERSRD